MNRRHFIRSMAGACAGWAIGLRLSQGMPRVDGLVDPQDEARAHLAECFTRAMARGVVEIDGGCIVREITPNLSAPSPRA